MHSLDSGIKALSGLVQERHQRLLLAVPAALTKSCLALSCGKREQQQQSISTGSQGKTFSFQTGDCWQGDLWAPKLSWLTQILLCSAAQPRGHVHSKGF